MCYWHGATALELTYACMIAPGSNSETGFKIDVSDAMTMVDRIYTP